MGIKKTSGNFDNWLNTKVKQLRLALINMMCYMGEECVKYAREHGNYQDRTGNLRSSIGYVILDNGKIIVQGGFEKTLKGSDGQAKGKAFIQDLISKHSKGIVLIVVAGMEYAEYVEAMENYDVITSSELLAKREIPKMLRQLKLAA